MLESQDTSGQKGSSVPHPRSKWAHPQGQNVKK